MSLCFDDGEKDGEALLGFQTVTGIGGNDEQLSCMGMIGCAVYRYGSLTVKDVERSLIGDTVLRDLRTGISSLQLYAAATDERHHLLYYFTLLVIDQTLVVEDLAGLNSFCIHNLLFLMIKLSDNLNANRLPMAQKA